MQIILPPFPQERLIKESCEGFNLLHPDAHLDPDTGEWGQVYAAVLAFLRHSHCLYEAEPRAGGDRDRLHAELTTAAKFKYPWLRLSKDPRKPKEEAASRLVFSERSRKLSALVSQKDLLLRARAELRREFRPDYKERLGEINARIRALEAEAAGLYSSFAIAKGVQRGRVPYDCSFQTEPGYVFGGRVLAWNYVTPLDYSCARCEHVVFRTKRPLDHGCGIYLMAFSCICQSVSVTPDYTPKPSLWEEFGDEGTAASGSIPRGIDAELEL
jgi:hypothetical protein